MHSSIGVLVMVGVGRMVGAEVLEWRVLVGAVVDRRWITRTSTGGTMAGTVRRSSSLRLRCCSIGWGVSVESLVAHYSIGSWALSVTVVFVLCVVFCCEERQGKLAFVSLSSWSIQDPRLDSKSPVPVGLVNWQKPNWRISLSFQIFKWLQEYKKH